MDGLSNFQITEICNKLDNKDLNFVGDFLSDKMNQFFFKKMMKGKKYPFLIQIQTDLTKRVRIGGAF